MRSAPHIRFPRRAAALALAVLLAACGGGAAPTQQASQQSHQARLLAASGAITFPRDHTRYAINKLIDGYAIVSYDGDALVRVTGGEPLRFADQSLALATDGVAGSAYRLYQAAFNRVPDAAGLGYWIDAIGRGMTLQTVATNFMASSEFKLAYGAAPGNAELIARYYENVLHRQGDPAGAAYWLEQIERGSITPAQMLAFFSEGDENRAGVAGAIKDGIAFREPGVRYTMADAGPAQTAAVGDIVQLSGAASTAADGKPLATFEWTFLSKPAGSAAAMPASPVGDARISFLADAAGSYVVQLSVTDGAANHGAPATATITVNGAAPGAAAFADPGLIATSGRATYAIKADGTLWSTGDNTDGQLGYGDDRQCCTRFVSVLGGARAIAAGRAHVLALKGDGSLWGAGDDLANQLGLSEVWFNSPQFAQTLTGVKAIAAGSDFSLALKADGTLWQAGNIRQFSMTVDEMAHIKEFGQVLSGVRAIAAGQFHSLALKEDGTLWVAGNDSFDQLGTPGEMGRFSLALRGVKSIAAAGHHSFALKDDGSLWAAGDSMQGELGLADISLVDHFVQIATGVQAMAAGDHHTLILKADGSVWGSGSNKSGQLGNGDGGLIEHRAFVPLAWGVSAIAAGGDNSLILKRDGSLWGTGPNGVGQLGNGDASKHDGFILLLNGVATPRQ